MLFSECITVLKGYPTTPKTATDLRIARGIITKIEVQFPSGCAGTTHVQICHGLHQIFPKNPDGDIASLGEGPDYSPDTLLRYGSFKYAQFTEAAKPNDIKTLCSVSGKGQVYGGLLFLSKASTAKLDEPVIEVDGIEVRNMTFGDLDLYGCTSIFAFSFYILRYDDNNFVYSVGISPKTTFEKSLKIAYREQYGHTPTIRGFLIYALIE